MCDVADVGPGVDNDPVEGEGLEELDTDVDDPVEWEGLEELDTDVDDPDFNDVELSESNDEDVIMVKENAANEKANVENEKMIWVVLSSLKLLVKGEYRVMIWEMMWRILMTLVVHLCLKTMKFKGEIESIRVGFLSSRKIQG